LRRVCLCLILLLPAAAAPGLAGCGDDDSPDPESVVRSTLNPSSPSAGAVADARVVVESLGFGDRVLDSRTVPVDADAYEALRRALSVRGDGGLASLLRDFSWEGTEQLDGVSTDHVSGSIDVEGLVRKLGRLDASGAGAAPAGALPGISDLQRLEKSLVGAEFDLYSATGDRRLERLDLTLAVDDPDNALPPTRIRFSLTVDRPSEIAE
jgi:hypothetical protein